MRKLRKCSFEKVMVVTLYDLNPPLPVFFNHCYISNSLRKELHLVTSANFCKQQRRSSATTCVAILEPRVFLQNIALRRRIGSGGERTRLAFGHRWLNTMRPPLSGGHTSRLAGNDGRNSLHKG